MKEHEDEHDYVNQCWTFEPQLPQFSTRQRDRGLAIPGTRKVQECEGGSRAPPERVLTSSSNGTCPFPIPPDEDDCMLRFFSGRTLCIVLCIESKNDILEKLRRSDEVQLLGEERAGRKIGMVDCESRCETWYEDEI